MLVRLLAQTAAPIADAATFALTHRVFGVVSVVLAVVIVMLYRENKAKDVRIEALQAQRVADTEKYAARLLEMGEKWITAEHGTENAVEALRESTSRLTDAFDNFDKRRR